MKKLLHKALPLFSFFAPLFASATLNTGDLAVIGMNCDGTLQTRTFSVVALAAINAGEVIYFTDRGISAGAFTPQYTTEGVITVTTTTNITMGTVFIFTVTGGTSPSVTCSPSLGTLSFSGWTSTGTTSPWGEPGDQILIYQAGPTFIYGFNNSSIATGVSNGWNTGTSTNLHFSTIPPGLTNGVNAMGFGGGAQVDNLYYSGSRSGEKATLLSAISNTSNWTSSNTDTYDLSPGGTLFTGTNPIFSSSLLPVHLVSFTGRLEKDHLHFNWEVGTEENFSHYEIEGSTNGTVFTAIGSVDASGKKTYQCNLNNAAIQQYYRLKMIDNNGQYRYSRVIMLLNPGSGKSVVLYPNPVSATVTISSKAKIDRIRVTDMAGLTILLKQVNGNSTSIDIQHLVPGHYHVHIYTAEEMIVKRITKYQ